MTAGQLRAEDLPSLLDVPLSQEQLSAATAPLEPGLIVAGAGSGKTTVMAARVVWLVGTQQVAAAGVLGLTFTNKAAAELLQRIRSALARLGGNAADSADDALVATYHAFAGAMLREFGLLIGCEPTAELMSAVRQRQLAYRVAVRADLDPQAVLGSPGEVAARIVALDSLLADSGVEVADLIRFDEELLAGLRSGGPQQRTGERMMAAAAARRELAGLVSAFRAAKAEREVWDFADYVRLGASLSSRHPDVGRQLRSRHQVVLLDEYQDTSVAQRGMLQALFGGGHPVTAVGDPCQAIYGWRGASPHNMDGFPDHFPRSGGDPAAVYTLATNRRSGADILSLANDVSADLRSVHRGVLQLRPDERRGSGNVTCALLPTVDEELSWLVGQLGEAARPWRDIAVLARTNGGVADVVAALRAAGIPVQVLGRQALLALPEVRWMVWALRLIADAGADDALGGLLMGPPWRVGVRDMALLARRAADLARPAGQGSASEEPSGGESGVDGLRQEVQSMLAIDPLDAACLYDALHDPGPQERYPYSAAARRRFGDVARLVSGWQRRAAGTVADLIRAVAAESGLATELQVGARGGAPGRPADAAGLQALVELARTFDDMEHGQTLKDFLTWLSVAEDLSDGPAAPVRPLSDAVTVMTVHAAKGLEFPVVAVPGLVEGAFPSDRGRGVWPTSSGVLPVALLQDPVPDPVAAFPSDPERPRAKDYDAFSQASRAVDRLEESRLAYVALTRARERLLLSGHRWGRTRQKPRTPSDFLTEAARAAAAGRAVMDVWALPPEPDATNPLLGLSGTDDRPAPPQPEPERVGLESLVGDPAAAGGSGLSPAGAGAVESWDRSIELLRAERAAARAPVKVQVPAEVSVSGWLAQARDADAEALRRARPLPQPVSPGAAVGERFHEWVAARQDQLSMWDADDLIDTADHLPEPGWDKGRQHVLQAALAASPFGSVAPIAVEHEVWLPLGGRVVRGRIDAVLPQGEEHWVVDWKTGASGSADPLQLAVYRLGWARQQGIDPERVVGCFVYLAQRRFEVFRGLPDEAGLQRIASGAKVAVTPTTVSSWEV